MNYLEALKNRRSIYGISDEEVVSRDKITEIVEQGLLHIPTPFNIQANRALVLYGEESDKFWDGLLDVMKEKLTEEQFPKTQKKLESFKAGYGTILYYIYQPDMDKMKEDSPSYAHNFDSWADQSSGMFQYFIWSALEAEGLGASLQHYNELIEEWTKAKFNLPDGWVMRAQMPFGKPTEAAGDKEFKDLSDTLIVKSERKAPTCGL